MLVNVEGGEAFVNTGGRALDVSLPSLVFVHGSGLDQSVWALQNRYFAHLGLNALAVDLPGHGKSARPTPVATISGYSDWVKSLIGALGLKDYTLVGHSMGSLIALDAAAKTEPSKLILLGAADAIPVHPSLLEAAKDDVAGAASFMAATGFGPRGHRGPSAVPGNNLLANGQRLFEHGQEQLLFDDLAACDGYGDGLTVAAKVACPALLILGQVDRMTPVKRGKALAAALPKAQVEILPGTGHMVMLEEPRRVNRLMRDFLAA